jgi:3'(2'), 5'-bisphosphate nucleotidase
VVVGVLGCPNLEVDPDADQSGRGCLFVAVRGAGTKVRALDGGRELTIRVDSITDPAQAVICESVEAAHAAHSVHARIAEILSIGTRPFRIDSQCKYAVVARGQASIYLRLPRSAEYREKVWDHAAGALVIEEAGGRVSDLDGRPLDFSAGRHLSRQRGIIVTNGTVHDQVLAAARQALGEGD